MSNAATPPANAGTTPATPSGTLPTGATPSPNGAEAIGGSNPTPENIHPEASINNPQGMQNQPNANQVNFTKEQFDKLTQEIEELREYAQQEQYNQTVKQLENEILGLEKEFSQYGFNAEQTLQAMLADPRFQDKQLGEAMKANYSGALGVFKYWSENKKNISIKSEAGPTIAEHTKKLLEKASGIREGKVDAILMPEDEAEIINHFINLNQGVK